jgi:hypothetical protein
MELAGAVQRHHGFDDLWKRAPETLLREDADVGGVRDGSARRGPWTGSGHLIHRRALRATVDTSRDDVERFGRRRGLLMRRICPDVREEVRAIYQVHGEHPLVIDAEELVKRDQVGVRDVRERAELVLEKKKEVGI